MARKTLDEKRVALQRKKTKFLAQIQISENNRTIPLKVRGGDTQLRPVDTKTLEEDGKRIQFFFQDLRKSFILILLITTLEIVFYFASMNKYFVSLLKF